MSPIDFDVRSNMGDVLRDLDDAEGRTDDLRPVFWMFDRRVSMFARRQFETAGAVGGEQWEPLDPDTKRQRLNRGETDDEESGRGGNRGGVNHPLWDFGKLKASLQTPGGEGTRAIDRQRYMRGTQVLYAPFHQEGTEDIPARPIFPDPWPDQLRLSVNALMRRHFEGRLPSALPGAG